MTTFRTTKKNDPVRQRCLERRTHSFNLAQNRDAQNLSQTPSIPHQSKKGVPPPPQRFKASGGLLAGFDKNLLELTFAQLELGRVEGLESGPAPGGAGWCVTGPDSAVRQVQNFANLFTSLRHHLPDGRENDKCLGAFCAALVMHSGFKLSSQDIVSGCSSFVQVLASQLEELAQSHPVLAFEVFTQCSTLTRVAVRECKGKSFVTIGEVNNERVRMQAATHLERCAKLMASDAGLAVNRGDSQLLKRFLRICTDSDRAELVRTFTRVEDRVVLLCTADPELAHMVLQAVVSLGTCPVGFSAQRLHARLVQLPQRPRASDGKVPEQVDLGRKQQILDTLNKWKLLEVSPSGGLNLNNVPMQWDFPVTEVIALMTMESPGTVFRLALQLFAGFAGEVKRSSPRDWATVDAVRAFSVLEAYVVQLEKAADPIVPLAKEVCRKFRAALVRAWDELDSGTRVGWLSAWAPGLDGYELALWRELQIWPDTACDKVLRDWLGSTLKDGLDGNPSGMRRCGVLGAALAEGARPDQRAANFIGDTLISFILAHDQNQPQAQALDLLLAMLAEADEEVFGILANANIKAPHDRFILHVDPLVQTLVESAQDLEVRIKAWMQSWFAATYSTAFLDAGAPPPSEFSLVDYQSAQMTVAMLPSDVVLWKAQLEKDAALLAGADPASPEATRYVQEISTALQDAQKDWNPPQSVMTVINEYVFNLAEARRGETLTAVCEIFSKSGKQKNQSGQVLFATALGTSALSLWSREAFEESAMVLASFLNTGPITPAAMKAFAYSTYGIFESSDLKAWWKNLDSLFTDRGQGARDRWITAVKDLARLNSIGAPTLIKKLDALQKLSK